MAPLPPPPPPPPHLPPPGVPPPPPPPPVLGSTGPQIVNNTYDHERQRWGLLDGFIVIAIFFVTGLILTIPAAVTTNLDDLLTSPWLPVVLIGPVLAELGYLAWISRRKGLGFAKDFQLRFVPMDLLTGLLCWFLAGVLAIVVVIIMSTFGVDEPTATAADIATDSAKESGVTLWLVLFAIGGATLIPLVEELVFRGLLWSALEKRGVHNVVTLGITSVLFAAIHLEPQRFFILLGLGAALGLGRLATGRIAASIVAHMLLNAIAFTVVLALAS